jgi:hypothetical protein
MEFARLGVAHGLTTGPGLPGNGQEDTMNLTSGPKDVESISTILAIFVGLNLASFGSHVLRWVVVVVNMRFPLLSGLLGHEQATNMHQRLRSCFSIHTHQKVRRPLFSDRHRVA